MAGPMVLIFHRPASPGDPALVRLLADARGRLAEQQSALFRRLGGTVAVTEGDDSSFGELLAAHAPRRGGAVVMGSGAVARLNAADARRLLQVAGGDGRRALTNNRYSSDVCAVSHGPALRDLPPLPGDNALPRWLEERAGFEVAELPGRERLALDIDTPQDVGLWGLAPDAPAWVRSLVGDRDLEIPRRDELRAIATDPHAELVVFGRSGSATLRWLERNVRCRVRFLAEERGLRASSPLAIGGSERPRGRMPQSTLSLLLHERGPQELGAVVGRLAEGAIIDSRVLLAGRHGTDEATWPPPADRYASDLLLADDVGDPWLRELTAAARASAAPILLGAHTLVGPGIPLVLSQRSPKGSSSADTPRCR
jgi:hypothetical protein